MSAPTGTGFTGCRDVDVIIRSSSLATLNAGQKGYLTGKVVVQLRDAADPTKSYSSISDAANLVQYIGGDFRLDIIDNSQAGTTSAIGFTAYRLDGKVFHQANAGGTKQSGIKSVTNTVLIGGASSPRTPDRTAHARSIEAPPGRPGGASSGQAQGRGWQAGCRRCIRSALGVGLRQRLDGRRLASAGRAAPPGPSTRGAAGRAGCVRSSRSVSVESSSLLTSGTSMTARSASAGTSMQRRGPGRDDVGRAGAPGEGADLAEEVAGAHRRQAAVAAVRLRDAGRRLALEDEVGGRRLVAVGDDPRALGHVAHDRVARGTRRAACRVSRVNVAEPARRGSSKSPSVARPATVARGAARAARRAGRRGRAATRPPAARCPGANSGRDADDAQDQRREDDHHPDVDDVGQARRRPCRTGRSRRA